MKTKIILEFGCNHQGQISLAERMIDDANRLGVWGVKFQKRDLKSFPEELKNKPRDLKNSFGKTYYEHRRVLEFTAAQIGYLKNYAEQNNLCFICSAFDLASLKELATLNIDYIKLPSQLYSDNKLQSEIIKLKERLKFKIFVSTGMHNAKEIVENSWLNYADLIFHCISSYPCHLKEMNLLFIQCLKELSIRFNQFKIGYSSHDFNGYGIKYAVLSGAEYIERHYTLDKKMKGSDHSTVSSDFEEMQEIISNIEEAEKMLGDNKRECGPGELRVRKIYRGF